MSKGPNDVDDGRGALRDFTVAAEPPAALEARVRDALVERALIRRAPPSRSTWFVRAGLLAAGIVMGVLLSNAWTGTSRRTATPPGQYVLLLLGETSGDTGVVHVAREREYGQWASSLTNGARWVGGHELGDVVHEVGPKPVGLSADDRLAGYFVIDAPSRDVAAAVARSCPHLKYGGRVVVMTIAS